MMRNAGDLRKELETWCASYVAAFEAFDVPAIGAHWMFPAMIVSGTYQGILSDAGAFNKNTAHLTSFYKRQNVQGVTRSVLDCSMLAEQTAVMRVQDAMSSPKGDKIAEWVSAYVLKKTSPGWRAIFADATGEEHRLDLNKNKFKG
jgi:hypothetical protein